MARQLSWKDVGKCGLNTDKYRQNSPNYNWQDFMKANARHISGTKVSRMQPGSVALVYIKRVSYIKNK